MDIVYFSNEFPNEDLHEIVRHLHIKSRDTKHPLLARFITESTWAVKDEIRKLPADLKRLFQPVDTLLTWVEDRELREGALCGAVDGVLLIIIQIAAYIGYIERNPSQLHNLADAHLSALGIGLLSSAAVALSPNSGDLPLAGADAVRLAFRLGVHVCSVSELLEQRDLAQSPETWAYVVHNVDATTAQRELDSYNSRHSAPETSKIFVSAVSRTSITVSGPPSILGPLFDKSEFFRGTRSIALPVYGGLCHAPHIYGAADTYKIVNGGETPLHAIKTDRTPVSAVYSTSTGRRYPATTAQDLFESLVSELLTKSIRWESVINGLVAEAKCAAVSQVTLHSFGNSLPLNDLSANLKSAVPAAEVLVNSLLSWISRTDAGDDEKSRFSRSKLAIVGMSCRLPGGATSNEKFWEILEQGLDVSRRIPADRFDIDTHYDPTGKQLNKTMTQYGCFIDEPGMFDAPFFNMSPREAQVVDPQMRLSLVTAFEALEQAGHVLGRTVSTSSQRIGTYYGQAADDYREVNQGQEVSTYYIPGGCRAFGPGRINYFFKFAGPSYSIDTACSSGLAAIEVACQALWDGTIDTAVAGGVNVLTNPDGFAGLCNGHFLTKGHNACKTWDATADGYCRADGVGSLVIKRLEDAEADNDNILGVILAAGTNHSAEAVSITHPHAGHQAYLSRQILRQAGVNPLDVSYVEMHGTGTQAGDFEEMQGVMDVYAPIADKRRSKDQPLYIGSVKSNVGHGESNAGTTALIKVLLMLQKNAIPPHIGIKTGEINPRFPKNLDKRNLNIAFEKTPWLRGLNGKKRIASVNNFGAAGGNTMMVLEEAPSRPALSAADDVRQVHTISVSAKTKTSLTANVENLISYLEAHEGETRLADLAYTTTARRYQFSYRQAFAVSDVGQLKKQLRTRLPSIESSKPVSKSPRPVIFAFTGQGAAKKSMSLELYRDVPSFREHLQHLDAIARAQGFPSFIPALDGSFPETHAHTPVVTQLSLVCTEMALAKYWSSIGIKPDAVVGHSLGEFAALYTAGVVTAHEAIFMAGRRAQLLEERCQIGSHAMMAVRASLVEIDQSVSSSNLPYTIACRNGPSDTVLSGTTKEMDDVKQVLESAGYRCIKLDVAFAFHSAQTDPILDDFEAACKSVVFSEPKLPVISPLLGSVVFDGKTINAAYMRRSTREAVDFVSAIEDAHAISTAYEDTVWIEIGPHPVCVGFVKSIMSTNSELVCVPSMRRGEENWKTLAGSMATLHEAGLPIDWNEFHAPFEKSLRLLNLPSYAWNNKNYWMQYNGDWCLTKGNTFYDAEKSANQTTTAVAVTSEISTSVVQQIISMDLNGSAGTVIMQSDLMQPDFLAAANGHRMNDCGVVTSSIHADIAYTLGGFLYRKLVPKAKENPKIDITKLHVEKGLVAQTNTKVPQLIRVSASTADISTGLIEMTWYNVDQAGNTVADPFATAQLAVGDPAAWLASWEPLSHLISSRIEALERLASEGKASRFTRNMAYTLFASNLVDYADKYRGMQSVVMHDFEACAEVELTTKEGGTWTVPPYFIDSVAHLAGFVMNCSDAHDVKNNYCVTPGWNSMRFAQPLVAGARYRSYVKMIPTKADETIFFGDVYIMSAEDSTIIGMVGGIQFRRYPRILLNRFFSPPGKDSQLAQDKPRAEQRTKAPVPMPAKAPAKVPAPSVVPIVTSPTQNVSHVTIDSIAPVLDRTVKSVESVEPPAPAVVAADTTTSKALDLIATEAGLELDDLTPDASFADLGVDSLMSLVISEKLGKDLGVKVGGSLFLDYPTIGDLSKWLDEYYS